MINKITMKLESCGKKRAYTLQKIEPAPVAKYSNEETPHS